MTTDGVNLMYGMYVCMYACMYVQDEGYQAFIARIEAGPQKLLPADQQMDQLQQQGEGR